MLLDDKVDVAIHMPHANPLDPFTGKFVTRCNELGEVSVVRADQNILLDCGFLWDIVANAAVFSEWVSFFPPERRLDLESNFNVNPLIGITMLPNLPTNKPTFFNSRPMCQHWTMVVKVADKTVAYRIGSYRPRTNTMEASWVD